MRQSTLESSAGPVTNATLAFGVIIHSPQQPRPRMQLIAALITATLLDRWLGEPRRYHPLVGFGRCAGWIEHALYGRHTSSPSALLCRGTIALVLAVAPFAVAAAWLASTADGVSHWLIATLALYLAIGHTSLRQHALAVADALHRDDLAASRTAVNHLVSRDTEEMEAGEISLATIESVLENGNDAVLAALFWFAVAGIPGVVVYRLVNTLDAMWGYKNTRYLYFGRAAARLDDCLNWLPARLTAFSYALLGHTASAMRCWCEQGGGWKSSNAGVVMAAGAGALRRQLGGGAHYHSEYQHRPLLGCGAVPQAVDIRRALALVQRVMLLWVAVIVVVVLLF